MEPETYPFTCPLCQKSYDVLAAPICDCIGTTRTFVCPHCGKCFCRLATSLVTDFWQKAPEAVWEKRRESRATGNAAAAPADDVALRRPLVLIVDDDPVIERIARRAIESMGYGVIAARNGADGLEAAKTKRPDVVLADALMPKLDGREMCRRLREDSATGSIRTVVMSAVYTSSKAKAEAIRQYGVDEFLPKPLSVSDLRATLTRLVGPPLAKD